MYAFLLVAGAVTTVAGMALVASGVSTHQGDFDASLISAGTTVFVGGLLLIGLGLAVRILQRIERVLAVRPMPRPARVGEVVAVATETTERQPQPQPVRIPFPPKPKVEPRQQAAAASVVAVPPPEPATEVVFEQIREKFPTLVRLEQPPVVEESEVSLLPRVPGRQDEEQLSVVANGHAPGRVNGVMPVARTSPRSEPNPRQARALEQRRTSVFESLWPKGARGGRPAQGVAVQQIPEPPLAEAVQRPEPLPESQPALVPQAQQQKPAPVSVLKSGVVDGMAYTLYSDGSIEAQLPQGILRFGSITELRNHIEQGS